MMEPSPFNIVTLPNFFPVKDAEDAEDAE
jgi:hypothetical protein